MGTIHHPVGISIRHMGITLANLTMELSRFKEKTAGVFPAPGTHPGNPGPQAPKLGGPELNPSHQKHSKNTPKTPRHLICASPLYRWRTQPTDSERWRHPLYSCAVFNSCLLNLVQMPQCRHKCSCDAQRYQTLWIFGSCFAVC